MQSFKKHIDEAVEIRHDRYMRSHGKKARGGTGMWMFTHKDRGDVDYNNDKEVHTTNGKFADAAKSAKAWAKKHGHSAAYVMEEVELEEAYKATSEKSQFGGHRAHLKNPQGKTSYMGAAGYKKPEHAKGEAQAYHDAYFGGPMKANERGAERAVAAYRAKHKEHMHVKEEVEQLEELTASEKKLINQMYDKKGNLTPIGKKVMDAGQKKESVEHLDELSPNTLSRYAKKADKQADKASDSYSRAAARRSDFASDTPAMAKNAKKFAKRDAGAALARKKLANKNESVELDESEINDITAQYINENNITVDQLENMTEEELNELIGKAIGGAFKLGAKAAVGATRLAGKAVKRASTAGRAAAAEKKADSVEKKNKDRERIKAAQDRLRKAKEASRNK